MRVRAYMRERVWCGFVLCSLVSACGTRTGGVVSLCVYVGFHFIVNVTNSIEFLCIDPTKHFLGSSSKAAALEKQNVTKPSSLITATLLLVTHILRVYD